MDAGKDISAASSVAAVAAARQVAATEVIGLLTPKGGLSATDITLSAAAHTSSADQASTSQTVAPTVTELSPGAQLLLKLLGAGSSPAPPLQAALPLLPAPPEIPAQGAATAAAMAVAESGTSMGAVIAQALQAGLEHSGLFYESHLADWVAGQRSLAAIHTEPQAAWHAPSKADTAASAYTGAVTHPLPETTSTPEPLNAIVGAQLDVIDSGQLRWQGELWPGLRVELWLQRKPVHNDADSKGNNKQPTATEEADSHHWQAQLVTTLPMLGKVSTRFSLKGEQLDLKLRCARPETAAALQSASPQLAGSLGASGLQLHVFRSDVDDAAPTA